MNRLSVLIARLVVVAALVPAAMACGKKGPPLPPLRPVPDKPTNVSVLRRDGEVTIRYTTPVRNQDGSEPFTFDRIEIFAMTVPAGSLPPTLPVLTDARHKVGEAAHDLAWPPVIPAGRKVAADEEPAPKAVALTFTESVPVVPLPPAPPVATGAATTTTAAASAPVGPQKLDQATRYYMLVPYATRSRRGAVSDFLPVALGPLPEAPPSPTGKYDEQTLTLSWKAASGTTYQVYDVTTPLTAKAAGLSPTPLTAGEFKRPVVFNARVCFALRTMRTAGPVQFESAPSAPWCETPRDTFPPPAPSGLVAFASEGSIDLSWDAVTAADLAGYLVLRGDGSSETLQPLMTTPVTATSFKDATAKAGVRYTYAVVAVDNAVPANRSKESTRVEETGRTQR